MKRFTKKILCIVFTMIMLLNIAVTNAFASELSNEVINGVVVNSDSNDFEGVDNIKIDVYALNEVSKDSDETDYDIELAFYVMTDVNGQFSFTKPTPNCIVEIDCDTVGDEYGVLVGKDILSSGETLTQLSISLLDSYAIDLENNELSFYNADDETLSVKENLNTDVVSTLDIHSVPMENVVSPLSDIELAATSLPVINNETTYTRGFFTYHYESGTLTDTELRQISNYFNHAKSSLCSTYNFIVPNVPPGESTYPVYLLDGISGLNGYLDAIDLSWSFISIDISNGVSSSLGKTICHEFTHAVQFTYRHFSDPNYTAYSEGVADLVGFILTEVVYTDWLNQFQNSPELSLFDNGDGTGYSSRDYGSMLFALYLYENYDYFDIIKETYEEYAEVLNIYTAIDNVLKEQYNSSLVEEYLNFRVALYDVYSSYDTELPTNINAPKKTNITENIDNYTIPKLSTMYFEWEDVAEEDRYTFYFTLDRVNTTTSEVNLKAIYTDPDGNITVTEYPFQSKLKAIGLDLEEGSTICFVMSNINLTDKNIQFDVCI